MKSKVIVWTLLGIAIVSFGIVIALLVRDNQAGTSVGIFGKSGKVTTPLVASGDCKVVTQEEPLQNIRKSSCATDKYGPSEWWCISGKTPQDNDGKCTIY